MEIYTAQRKDKTSRDLYARHLSKTNVCINASTRPAPITTLSTTCSYLTESLLLSAYAPLFVCPAVGSPPTTRTLSLAFPCLFSHYVFRSVNVPPRGRLLTATFHRRNANNSAMHAQKTSRPAITLSLCLHLNSISEFDQIE